MAQLVFLGTAGSAAVYSKQLRSSGGMVLRIEDLQFHIDPGPGALVKAKEMGVNLHHNTAIFVTHNHLNHCNDLNVVIDAMTHGGIEHRGLVLASKSVLQPTENTYPIITKYHQGLVEKIIPLEKNHKVGVDLVEIHVLPSEHTDPTAIGFKFLCPHFVLSYPGDTIVTPQLLENLMGSDVLILNVPTPVAKPHSLNLDVAGAMTIISTVKPRLAILTHFDLEMIKADPLSIARDIQRATGVQTIAAHDGLVISPDGYGKEHSPVKGYS